MLVQTSLPITQRRFGNGEARSHNLSRSTRPATRARPCEKCDCSTWASGSIAIIQMVSRGIVEIDCPLGEPKPQKLRVKINIALGIAGDRGDMMNTVEFH